MAQRKKRRSAKPAAKRGAQRKLRVHVTHGPTNPPSQRLTPERIAKAAKAHPGILAGIELTHGDGKEALDAALGEAEVLLVASSPDLGDLASRAPRLKWIQSTSAGVEKLVPLVPDGVALTNASGVHGPRGGEYGMVAIFMLNSRVPDFVANKAKARWEQIQTTPVTGKTVVLLGVGSIGEVVARHAKQFGMKVIGVTRGGKKHRFVDRMVTPKQLRKVLPQADFLVSTLPLTPETEGLIGRAELDLLPRHAGVVNLGRAKVIDYDALLDKLHKGELAGAVLDVFDPEPLPPDSPWWSAPNTILSPHCAVDDESDYVARCLDIFFDNLKRFRAGRALRNRVDTRLGY